MAGVSSHVLWQGVGRSQSTGIKQWRSSLRQSRIPPVEPNRQEAGVAVGGEVMLSAILSLALFGAGTAQTPGHPSPVNLVQNGGFEEEDDRKQLPDHWQFGWEVTHSGDSRLKGQKHQPDVSWDNEERHTGRRSVRVGVRRKQDDGVWNQEGIRHVPGTRVYRVSAAIKTQQLHDSEARIALVFLGEKNKWLSADYSAIVVAQDSDWKEYSRLVMAPAGTQRIRLRCWVNMRNSGTGTAWFDDVRLEATDEQEIPGMQYVDPSPMPTLSQDHRRKGYVCFRRNPLELVFPASVPPSADIDGPLEGSAARGEYESLSFGIHARRPLRSVRVQVSDLSKESGGSRIPSSSVLVRPVRYLPKQGQARWGPFADGLLTVPLFLQDKPAIDIAAESSHWFWVDVHVPEDVQEGLYRGQVTVSPEAVESTVIPLTVRVYPFRLLEPPDLHLGMYCKVFKDLELFRRHCRDMRAHGMTTMGLCCPLGSTLSLREGKVHVDFDGTGTLEQALDIYKQVGFPAPLVWLMGGDVGRWCLKQGTLESEAFARSYRQVIEAVLAERRQRGWPEIIFQPVDEPFEHTKRLSEAKRCLQILKQIPGVRTEEDGPNGNPETLHELYEWSDVLVYHDGPVLRRGSFDATGWERFLHQAQRDQKEVWFYNLDLTGWHPEVMRFGYGLGLWQAGATGVIEWCYDWHRDGKPETAYVPKSIIYAYPATDTETGGPTIGWQAVREGADDFKYLYTLVSALEQQEPAKDRRVLQIRQQLLEQLAQIDFRGSRGSAAQGDWTGPKTWTKEGVQVAGGNWKMANGLTLESYGQLKRQLAEWIVEIGPPTEPTQRPLGQLIRKWRLPSRDFESRSPGSPRQ